ncbi:hypothetical protein PR048_015059 [Dryococelus australis]|uniref:Trafficking protein particle complex subunit 5 n=1 Tax=Dryococelus australis TaxID=614101 RepID=A0ABQ9HG22_9NEOP|nr:hypothetical protein PR048_015059 [Dryococelus australis]
MVVAKRRRALGMLGRVLNGVSCEVQEKAYGTMVRPLLEYAAAVWDPYVEVEVRELEKVKRKAARWVKAVRPRTSILDKSLSRGRGEVNLSCYALLFSELVQYCQNRVSTVPDLQNKLAEMGQEVGVKFIDLLFVRERNCKRENKLLNMLLFIKSTLWKALFGREADKLEHSNDDERTYYIIEKDPVVNKFISVPKDKGSLNCAMFTAGIIEAILNGCGFSAKVTAHWHKGTTYMVKFEDAIIARDKQLEDR